MKLLNEMFIITGGDDHRVEMRLDGEHPIYRAHFPGNPITPGVCIVQMVGELLTMRFGCRLWLSRVINLKFVAPLSPVECPRLEVNFHDVKNDNKAYWAKGYIASGGSIKTKFSLVFNKDMPVYGNSADDGY